MSNVLYDEPGPKARRRSLIGTVIVSAAILALLLLVARRLDEQGQFAGDLWAPLFDPNNEYFPDVWRSLGNGLRATLVAAVLAIAASLAVGTLLGVGRLMSGRLARIPLVTVIELLRGLPVIVTIFLVHTAVKESDLDLSFLPGDEGLWVLVVGLTLYNSVIIAEIVRAGVGSLPRGQAEAGYAIGLTRWRTMLSVQLPQAFRTMLPALISQLVVILKDTSLVAVLGIYSELLREGTFISQYLKNPLQVYLLIGAIFILINYLLSRLATTVERRLSTRTSGSVANAHSVTPTGANT
ncbi:amino acid ABC transporter permease [Nocardioides jishulii]|uniref:Amino acid ABC transporter permease n=1 Tax=Nocardioides jishulii TaxID=2575440 RepID=A0A4U2YUH7_9ACTN|nr:amino acid ABC transporter permease [Nocardioides jishulii]QCX28522.1 amino acid ABC transporter permease [Nocardioides jishulii]TKI64585.1 amino acid ABC transporter permease [Nocardioides jishulii]